MANRTPNIPYGTHGQVGDRYIPTSGSGRWPVVVDIHPGGWSRAEYTKDDPDFVKIAHAISNRGYFLFAPNYRLAPENPYPAAYEDVMEALAWTADKPKAIRDRTALLGGSAGGHLAALMAVRGAPVRTWVGLSGAYDFNQNLTPLLDSLIATFLGPGDSPELRTEASPITDVDGADVPAYMTNFTDDAVNGEPAVPSAQMDEMRDALTAVGVTVATQLIDGTGHAFSGWTAASPGIFAWLATYLA